jgi:hypothetical protein
LVAEVVVQLTDSAHLETPFDVDILAVATMTHAVSARHGDAIWTSLRDREENPWTRAEEPLNARA